LPLVEGERLPADVAEGALRDATTVPQLLSALTQVLIDRFDGAGAVVSRVVGDLLVDIANRSRSGESMRLGHGYLLSDFPLTQEVLEQLESRTVSVVEDSADPAEVALLRQLGFESLLMAPLQARGQAWALVEVYGDAGRRFDTGDEERVKQLLAAAGEHLERLG
jgi:GAF domain-containing protein